MAAPKSIYRCRECGATSPKWTGQCSSCDAWNTIDEEAAGRASVPSSMAPASPAVSIIEVSGDDATPIPTGVPEVDRVLGGGLVAGSVTLLGGEPGVGKSTLLLQVSAAPARSGRTVLYVSAEESATQVRRRAERLGALESELYLASETSLPHVLGHIEALSPDIVVIDSIQALFDPELASAPGSVGQVRHCAHRLVSMSKERDIATVLVGHVTKEGSLAGPRVLEHLVDTVLSFDGDRHHTIRVLRAVKHRFGSTQELGLFAMGEVGLDAVPDPSERFLADRRPGVAGSTVVPTIEGHRPLLVEVQALVADAAGPNPRRSATGVDSTRVGLLLAVLQQRLGVPVLKLDTFALSVGGARVTEPGADLGLGVAIVSSLSGRPVDDDVVVCGEVGLGGEVRAVHGVEGRLAEAARMGFRRAVVPRSTPDVDVGIEVLRVPTLHAAVQLLDLFPRG